MHGVAALLCGMVFGVGLAVSGMTDTAKVLGFLDIFGTWVPDLAFVMGSAVCVTLVAFRFVLKRKQPLLSAGFVLSGKTALDGRLLSGAAIFGIGWGVYGYCPGPALSALVYLDSKTVIFVVAMLVGMALANRMGST
ncbi:MAG TPA: YeeE/YedE family protein [Halieaceae bacterium]|nr:MAG: YeeE/YedE family protein [Gammaproteobacteria bacterium]HDY83998.1 YeeE/YedE family protein [Halieaceae bacterium]